MSGEPAVVDLEWSNFTIAGPPRSGRSTALAAVATALQRRHEVFVVGPASSPLAALGLDHAAFGGADQIAPFLDRLANQVALGGADAQRVLVVDDLDTFEDPMLAAILDRLGNYDSLRVVATLESRSLTGYTASGLVGRLRRSRRLLILQPDDPSEFLQTTGVKLAIRPGLRMPPGRGVLLTDRTPTVIQLAVVPGPTPGPSPGRAARARRSSAPDRLVVEPPEAASSVSIPQSAAHDLEPAHT